MCGFECTISTSIEKYIKVKCNYIKEWYFVSFFFYLIGNSFGIFLLNKTLREDAQLAEGKFELRSHSRAKESQATLCSEII